MRIKRSQERTGIGNYHRAPQAGPALRSLRLMAYCAMLMPEPPISEGKSFIFGNPSLMGSLVSP